MTKSEFFGASMREALQKAKEALGEDVLIIQSEQTEKGVKVYATTQEDEILSPKPAVSMQPVTRQNLQAYKNSVLECKNPLDVIKYIVEICNKHEIDQEFCDEWLELIAQDFKKDTFFLDDSLMNLIHFEDRWIYDLNYKTPVIAVGTPGSGKTAMIGKLALALKTLKKNICVISLDTHKAGGIHQLQTYLGPLEIPLESGFDAYLKAKDQSIKKDMILLVDTPGINILSHEGQEYMYRFSQKVRDPLMLILANDQRSSLMDEIAMEFAGYNAKYLCGTRFDMGYAFGGIINAAYRHHLRPLLFSNSPKLTKPLNIFFPRKILSLMTKDIPSPHQSSGQQKTG